MTKDNYCDNCGTTGRNLCDRTDGHAGCDGMTDGVMALPAGVTCTRQCRICECGRTDWRSA